MVVVRAVMDLATAPVTAVTDRKTARGTDRGADNCSNHLIISGTTEEILFCRAGHCFNRRIKNTIPGTEIITFLQMACRCHWLTVNNIKIRK